MRSLLRRLVACLRDDPRADMQQACDLVEQSRRPSTLAAWLRHPSSSGHRRRILAEYEAELADDPDLP